MVNTYTGPNKGVCTGVEMLFYMLLMAFICYKTKERSYPSKWYVIKYIIMCDPKKERNKETKGVFSISSGQGQNYVLPCVAIIII